MLKLRSYILSDKLEIRIAGGLGNQLFMFWAGLFIADYLKRIPIFEVSDLSRIQHLHPGRNIQDLGLLDDQLKIERELNPSGQRLVGRLFSKGAFVWGVINKNIFSPKELGYISALQVPKQTKKLSGYFQTWRYAGAMNGFSKVRSLISANASLWALDMGAKLDFQNPLCIHVRRGDYLEHSNNPLGVLSQEYYFNIIRRHPTKKVWIFTDSPSEVESIFAASRHDITVIKKPINSDHIDDLYLMSKSSTLAIANSTFSWWAAIMTSPNSKIYAPKKWFRNLQDPLDLIPINWHKIDNNWD